MIRQVEQAYQNPELLVPENTSTAAMHVSEFGNHRITLREGALYDFGSIGNRKEARQTSAVTHA